MNADIYLEMLNGIYETIPNRPCQDGCVKCCAPVDFSAIEAFNIKRFLDQKGMLPRLTSDGARCPYLDVKCTIYPVRPIICRLYGMSDHEHLHCDVMPPTKNRLDKHRTREIYRQVALLDENFRKTMNRRLKMTDFAPRLKT